MFLRCAVSVRGQTISLTYDNAVDWHNSLVTKIGGKTYRSCPKHKSLSLHDILSTCRHLLGVPFVEKLKSNLRTALTTHNATEYNWVILQAQNTTALQPIVFLTGIHRLLVTSKGRSASPSAYHCQGQL